MSSTRVFVCGDFEFLGLCEEESQKFQFAAKFPNANFCARLLPGEKGTRWTISVDVQCVMRIFLNIYANLAHLPSNISDASEQISEIFYFIFGVVKVDESFPL